MQSVQSLYVDVIYGEDWFQCIVPGLKWIFSKNFPTYPWNVPQTLNQQFMKEFFSFGGERGCLGNAPGECWGS